MLSGWLRLSPVAYGWLCPIRALVPAVRLGLLCRASLGFTGIAGRVFDAPPGYLFLAVDALGVDLEQDGDAVSGPLGDLGGLYAPVEPCRDASVPEVVDALGQRGRVFGGSQGGTARFIPHAAVGD